MANYDRPGHENPGTTDTLTRADNAELQKITGISPDEEQRMEDRAYDGAAADTAEREGLDKHTDDDSEKEKSDETEIPYNDNSPKKKRRGLRLSRNQGIVGGIAGLGIAGIVAVGGIVQGPLQIVHLSQLLQGFHFSNIDTFSNTRSSRYLFYRATQSQGSAKMHTRLGRVGNKVANSFENRMIRDTGLRPLYDASTGNIRAFEIVNDNKGINTLIDADIDLELDWELKSAAEVDTSRLFGLDSKPISGQILVASSDEVGAFRELGRRRSFMKAVSKTMDMNGIARSIGFRLTAARGALELSPLKRIKPAADENRANFSERIKKALKEKIKRGASTPGDVNLGEPDDPENPRPPDEEAARAEADRAGKEATAEARSAESPEVKKTSTAKKLAAAGAVGVGILCTAREISNSIEDVQHANIILPMMRMGTHAVAVGSQVMTGQNISMDELSVFAESLNSEELGSWARARSIQAELGNDAVGPDIPPTAKPSRVGEKPGFLDAVDTIFSYAGRLGGAACSRVGQFIIGGATGGWIAQGVGEVVSTIASSAGIDPMAKFSEWIVNTLAGDMIDVLARGPDFGNIVNYGARLAANEQALSMGGKLLSIADVAQLDEETRLETKNEMAKMGTFARLFDLSYVNSLSAKLLFENQTFASLLSPLSLLWNPGQVALSASGSIMNLLSPHAYAQSAYDYGFDEFGFTIDEQENAEVADPYENARVVEEELGLSNLNETYGDCFSTKINSETGRIEGTETADYNEVAENEVCQSNDLNYLRFRMYIADTVLLNSLACYQGDDTTCQEIGFGGAVTESTTSDTSNGPIANPGEDTSQLSCPPDPLVTDGGIGEKYGTGRVLSHRIRLCIIDGDTNLDVNVSIAQATANMVRDAAQAGIDLTPVSSAYRTFDHQADLRTRNGCADVYYASENTCSTPTARPGESNHEEGLAIDFSGIPKCARKVNDVCQAPGNAKWEWLAANAQRYGFKQLRSESWHWSVTGG